MRLATITAVIVLTGASAWLAAWQVKPAPPAASAKAASFEVVSIKPIQPALAYPNFFVEGDKLRGNHVTAITAIAFAYDINRRQIIGGPAWTDSERYNIDARAPFRLPLKTDSGRLQEPVAAMLRALLADRFALRVRRDTRQMSVSALVISRPNFKPREKHLRPAKIDCADSEARRASAVTDDEKFAVLRDCFERTGGELNVRGRPMERLAYQLGRHLNRHVIDETGLSGLFDVDLDWDIKPGVPEQPSILIALEEQLGMKLEERTALLPVLVIESIQRPKPN